MNNRTRWLVVVLVLGVAGVVALWPREEAPGPQPTSTRPTQDMAALRAQAQLRPCVQAAEGGVGVTCLGDGTRTALALKGPLLINFWATWCQPCQEELPVLDAYAKQPGAVPVVPVLVESREADGLELLTRLGVRLPSVHDGADELRKQVKAPMTLPATYYVAADGQVRQITDPPYFKAPEQVEKAVR
ncbi:TlpA family protein disulfide reductase [Lentzea sp. NEAU-D7]|uniref:TlpA family protein disulfide reductase n=1 Tax=Lentzea sp. NEAU-D7 TaxID=2994667 RepID=UPI00224A83F5|nr:TlpA disulfide reductase family protein [Lentzea sp. NEAU-D7]MCX2952440.1 TlpA disulfide reductase family protein [Lentzea sp. NEAU-D7]